jgi:uncharacterized membrane protein
MLSTRDVASTAIFTAFVAAATSVFSVYIPATFGYFNVGEVMVYTCALLMGPYIGAFAGGVGSMISDISLGYPYYAPGTLIIKGCEGFIVGYLGTKAFPRVTRPQWRIIAIAIGLVFSISLAYVGSTFFTGATSVTLGGEWDLPSVALNLQVPAAFWVALAVAAFLVIMVMALKMKTKSGQSMISVLAGGAEMVTGYYLYESFVLTLIAPASVVAVLAPAAEVPFNVAQALIGLLVAVPLARSIRGVTKGRRLGMTNEGLPPSGPKQ